MIAHLSFTRREVVSVLTIATTTAFLSNDLAGDLTDRNFAFHELMQGSTYHPKWVLRCAAVP
ncbi:hypothetical protein [Sinorhizobium meliloti]|uniref:hypothetical protein n=1 Tax=Rhizobium meliloti TaxID=382 RepID=UPI0018656D3E|nr:hypothetical protein [Sinorhizobium meliloti]